MTEKGEASAGHIADTARRWAALADGWANAQAAAENGIAHTYGIRQGRLAENVFGVLEERAKAAATLIEAGATLADPGALLEAELEVAGKDPDVLDDWAVHLVAWNTLAVLGAQLIGEASELLAELSEDVRAGLFGE